MKRIFTLIVTFILGSLLASEVLGQNAKLRYADKQFELANYLDAAKGYENAFQKNASYRAAKGAAQSYQNLGNYKEMYNWWKETLEFEDASAQDFLYYLSASNQNGNIEEVLASLDTLSQTNSIPVQNLHLDSLKHWYSNRKNMELISLADVNTSLSEFGITGDSHGNLYFSSDRGNVSARKKKNIRIDSSHKYYQKESDWTGRNFIGIYKMEQNGELKPLSSPVPETYHFTDPFFLKKQPLLFYTITRKIEKQKNRRDYTVYPEIYFSKLDDSGQMLDFKAFPFNSPVAYGVMNPFVDENAKKVYFSSDKPGGFGGYDIYYVNYDEDMNFGEPVNMGEIINSPGNELYPSIIGDKFYFSSDGHFGLGGLDLFEAHYKIGNIGGKRNLGIPYNSPQDDFSVFFSQEGDQYISSNRLVGFGLDDIYQIRDLFRRFLGRVVDCEGNTFQESLEVELLQKDGLIPVKIDRGQDGAIVANIAPEKEFQLKIKKKGYFTVLDNQLNSINMEGELLEKEYKLTKIPYQATVFVDLIYYNFDQSVIRENARPVLRKVADLMKDYSFIDILVRSHTDSRASNEYNEGLSQKRANAVKDYLGDFGISRSRVRSEWLGERELVNDCGDGIPCPESSHQLNRRSELILMAFPDEDQNYDLPNGFEEIDLCVEDNILMPMDMPVIYFDFDKSNLKPGQQMELERVALLLNRMVGLKLGVEGHTDSRGTDLYNETLSQKRSQIVGDYLVKKGISPERISKSSFGKSQPVYDCAETPCDKKMHQLNRRTELKLSKNHSIWK